MIKTNQFSAKTPYVTPWCKCAEIQPHNVILAGSLNGPNSADSFWLTGEEGTDGVNEYGDL